MFNQMGFNLYYAEALHGPEGVSATFGTREGGNVYPTESESRCIDALLVLLGYLQSVSLEIQKEKKTMDEGPALFDETVQ